MLRVISRPSTVPAERIIDRKAPDCTTCSTMPGSSLGAFAGFCAGGAAGAGAAGSDASGAGAASIRLLSIS